MTKSNWIKYAAIGVILLLIVAICTIEDRLVVSSLGRVKTLCYEIENVAVKTGIVNGEVASLVDNLEDEWEKSESKLCFMVNHKSIEQLAIEIVRLKTYIDEEEEIEFFVSLEIIKHYVESFQHFMGGSFHNVL